MKQLKVRYETISNRKTITYCLQHFSNKFIKSLTIIIKKHEITQVRDVIKTGFYCSVTRSCKTSKK